MRGKAVPTLEEYIVEKIQVLRELGIYVTPAQREKMKTLKSEIAIDNYAHSIIVHTEPVDFTDELGPENLYTIQGLSDKICVPYGTIYNWIISGRLKTVVKNRPNRYGYTKQYITKADLLDFLERNPKYARKTSLFIETEV